MKQLKAKLDEFNAKKHHIKALIPIFSWFDRWANIQLQVVSKFFYEEIVPVTLKSLKIYDIGNVSTGFFAWAGRTSLNVLDPYRMEWRELDVYE